MIATEQPLTDTDRRTIYQILSLHQQNGRPPTLRQLAKVLGVGHTGVHHRITRLRRKGVLVPVPRCQRASLILVASAIAEAI